MGRGRRERLDAMALDELTSHAALASDTSANSAAGHGLLDSELCKFLAKQWSWGFLSAVRVQQLAHAAYDDEHRLLQRLQEHSASSHAVHAAILNMGGSKTLEQFASLGNWGRRRGNCARELRNLLGEPTSASPHVVQAKTKIMKLGTRLAVTNVAEHHIRLPHEIFAYL